MISRHLRESSPSELKHAPQHFTRDGKLSPDLLIALLLALIGDGARRGYQNLIDKFWDDAREHGIPLPSERPVSAAAFCKARQKLRPDAIRGLLHRVVRAFDDAQGKVHRFKGRRILAVDGTKILTQRSDELWSEFGQPHGGYCPQLLASVLFDVVAKIPHDVVVGSNRASEREHLRELLKRMRPGDVVVLDRAYPSFGIIEELLDAKVDFVIRLPTQTGFKATQTFLESGGVDYRVMLRSDQRGHDVTKNPLAVRAIRREGKKGEAQVFVTSLSRAEFTRGEILRIYQMRWEVELFYRLEKGDYLGHHQFHARTPDGVKQEVFASLLYVALSRFLMAEAAQAHDVPYSDLSQKSAILAASDYLVRLLLTRDAAEAERLLDRILERIARRREPHRPNRSFPRRSFKQRPRWGPVGRLRG